MYLFLLSIPELAWTSREDALLSCLSENRQVRVQRFRHDSDKVLSLYAGLLTRMCIARYCKIPLSALEFTSGAHQKPILLTDPSVHFNFAHSGSLILLVISLKAPVGVDVEKIAPVKYDVMRSAFHPAEISYVTQGAAKNQLERFFQIWTKKEAHTKRIGTGLLCDLKSINTLAPDMDNTLHTWRQEDYMCSLSFEANDAHPLNSTEIPQNPVMLSTTDIWNFFCSSSKKMN